MTEKTYVRRHCSCPYCKERIEIVIRPDTDWGVQVWTRKHVGFFGQSVECHIIYIQENYVIVSPIREPEEIETVYLPQVQVDDIIEDLENMIEKLDGNAEVIPRALLRIIQLQQLMIKFLMGEA